MKKWCVAAAMAGFGRVGLRAVSLFQARGRVCRLQVDGGRYRPQERGGQWGMTTSYFGFSGIEDLGGGLAAGFKLGSFFAPTAASSVASTATPTCRATPMSS